jgi:hypothetical protein
MGASCSSSPTSSFHNSNNNQPPLRPPNKLDLSIPIIRSTPDNTTNKKNASSDFMVDWHDTTSSIGLVGFQHAGKTSLLTSALSNNQTLNNNSNNWKPKWLNDPERLERKTTFFKSQLIAKARALLIRTPIPEEDGSIIGREVRVVLNFNSTQEQIISALSFLLDAGVFSNMDESILNNELNAKRIFVDEDIARSLIDSTRTPTPSDAHLLREPSIGVLEAKMNSIRIVDCPGFPQPILRQHQQQHGGGIGAGALLNIRSHPYVFQKWNPQAPHIMAFVIGLHAVFYDPTQLSIETRAFTQLRQWVFDLAESEGSAGIFVCIVMTQIDTLPLRGIQRVQFLKHVAKNLVSPPSLNTNEGVALAVGALSMPTTWQAYQVPVRIAVANALDSTSSKCAMKSIGTFEDHYLPEYSTQTKFFDQGIVPHLDLELSHSGTSGEVYWTRSIFPEPIVVVVVGHHPCTTLHHSSTETANNAGYYFIWTPTLHRLFSNETRKQIFIILCCLLRVTNNNNNNDSCTTLPELAQHRILEYFCDVRNSY